MTKKGFTLIELLATITILGLIMMVAVPNVLSTIDKNKKNTYVEDAKKMITLAEYRLRSDTSIETPKNGSCIVIKLRALDLTELNEGPEGGDYSLDTSYVVITNQSGSYTYAATIVENYEESRRGLPLTTRADLLKDGAANKVKKDEELPSNEPIPGSSINGKYVQDVISS